MEMACPIRSVTIPGLSDAIELKGLVVVVGPNSSGKTQLLHDINEVVLGRKRELVVASAVEFNTAPNFEEYFGLLISTGSVVVRDRDMYRKFSFQFGTEEGGGDFNKSNAQ